jgi:CheY-like chemotaxis protein
MNTKRILIVDDEAHVIRVLRLTLEREGYAVETASDGVEALQKMAARLPDVLITDVQMPKAGGRVLCQTVRAQYPASDFLIIVMTSMTAIEERDWVLALKTVNFMEKPLSPRRLVNHLADHFNFEAATAE